MLHLDENILYSLYSHRQSIKSKGSKEEFPT